MKGKLQRSELALGLWALAPKENKEAKHCPQKHPDIRHFVTTSNPDVDAVSLPRFTSFQSGFPFFGARGPLPGPSFPSSAPVGVDVSRH